MEESTIVQEKRSLFDKIKDHKIILILTGLGFIFRSIFIYQNMGFLSNFWLFEDWGYVLKISRNLALGLGSTFDGINPTSGFEPLYTWIMVPVYMQFHGDIITPAYIALTILAISNVMTGFILYKLIMLFTKNKTMSYLGAAIWLFNPAISRNGTNGLETGLATFFVVLSIYVYIRYVRNGNLSMSRILCFGFLLGVTYLSRVDSMFLWFLFVSDIVITSFALNKKINLIQLMKNFKTLFFAAVSFAMVVIPYSIYNLHYFGYILPSASQVSRHYYPLDGVAYQFDNIIYVVLSDFAGKMVPRSGWYGLGETPLVWFKLQSYSILITTSIFVIGALSLTYLFLRDRNADRRILYFAIGIFFFIFALLYASTSTWVVERYYNYLTFLFVLLVSIFLFRLYQKSKKAKYLIIVVFVLLCISYGINIENVLKHEYIKPGFYEGTTWLNEHLNTTSDVVAGLQTGNVGYFYKGRSINLDGVVNIKAWQAERDGKMFEYIFNNKIDYIADTDNGAWTLVDMQNKEKADILRSKMELVHFNPSYNFEVVKINNNNYTKIINIDNTYTSSGSKWELLKGFLWPLTDERMYVNEDVMRSSQKGDQILFHSTSSCTVVRFAANPLSGYANIYVNAQLYKTVNLYSEVENPTYDLKIDGIKTPVDLAIEVAGQKDIPSKDKQVWVDAIFYC